MDDYIAISLLNDFIFCPYSIYLHNVYMESDESQYHAAPQTMGRIAHKTVDEKKTTNGKGDYSLNRKQFKKSDFVLLKSEYHLKNECCGEYYKLFYSTLISYKMDVFRYIQSYYRFFMQRKSETEFPLFKY
ncbi:type V CRISPR-associated protein Cas4 [Phocaeicola plebeius]|uniref:Type V CRISPR-associated protein Cas4 n=1 Tax=Phocaeicola plebeius TaxID=310297 RepID=A0A3E4WL13_9BACT|nr:type V CRISPR-associated protein Cas4 [Phocaeicola plebeius]RGM42837.1 type V CRISPR-associated protein Cas4 [Phocaeicola plebeius]RGQ75842.1 type V CRISPR-associated protein Cas4 [Phocaeicola plebeius]RGQ96884.1 type V CRISPR-associated protein Cas4 [Phocaeicola plebeius]RGZ57876.1 type V CRISPR-associated protein Cas4 [Phocaeicola plebeius]